MNDYFQILKGRMPERMEFPAVFAFSIHKAGSTLMHKMIREVCALAAIPAISIPDIMFVEGFMDSWESDERLAALIEPGRVYYGFRHLPPLLTSDKVGLRDRKSVLLVRDPRDALVSEYFSLGGRHFSHSLPEKNRDVFIERVMATADLSIDSYVLKAANVHQRKLLAYRQNLNFDNVLLRRYEDIYFNKEQFLKDIFVHFGLDVDEQIIKRVSAGNDVRPEVEDPAKHIRKGAPGDHLEKLQDDTIEKLNVLFSETCKWFGYDLNA